MKIAECLENRLKLICVLYSRWIFYCFSGICLTSTSRKISWWCFLPSTFWGNTTKGFFQNGKLKRCKHNYTRRKSTIFDKNFRLIPWGHKCQYSFGQDRLISVISQNYWYNSKITEVRNKMESTVNKCKIIFINQLPYFTL